MDDCWTFVKLKPQKNGFRAQDKDRTRNRQNIRVSEFFSVFGKSAVHNLSVFIPRDGDILI